MSAKVSVAFLVLCIACATHASKILGIFPFPAHSHYALGSRLMKALAEKGHEVTIITPYREKSPPKNYREIFLDGAVQRGEEKLKVNMFETMQMSPFIMIPFMISKMAPEFLEYTMEHDAVKKFLNDPNEQFDLVILEQFVDDAFMGFAHHFKAPLLLLSTIGSGSWTNDKVGNPAPPSYVPNTLLSFHPPLNFWQRLYNGVFTVYEHLLYELYFYPKMNGILNKYFPGAPPVQELHKNVSLILLNSHVSTNQPVPHTPNMIEIGGYHVYPPKKLPQDLQSYLDGAKDGVVYFSMGSNLKSKDMPEDKRDAILRALSKLKQKVLWKFEADDLPGKPDNVRVEKWLPQSDILAHPNVKTFITHGGLLSTIEAIYHGVPVIGIPIFGDQKTNMAKSVASGYGILVPYNELSEERLTAALNEILSNPQYRENAKVRSAIMKDQPVKPLDSAIYWVEYVIRHRGAAHFRSAAMELRWYEYHMLDVIAFVVIVTTLVAYVSCKLVKRLFSKPKKATKKQKKN